MRQQAHYADGDQSSGGERMAAVAGDVMPLQSGDRLTQEEFHRRYCDNPQIRRADLVLGVVYVPSPMRFDRHDAQTTGMQGWLYVYQLDKPNVLIGGSATLHLLADTEVQADCFLFYQPPSWPGGVRVRSDGYIDGAPELIVEVSTSSASYDAHDKKEAYRRAGVQEYINWRVFDDAIDWWRLRDGKYVLLEPDEHGVIESEVFPGLRLDVAKMLAGDDADVIGTLRRTGL
jgi:Uma2 family endonuclease